MNDTKNSLVKSGMVCKTFFSLSGKTKTTLKAYTTGLILIGTIYQLDERLYGKEGLPTKVKSFSCKSIDELAFYFDNNCESLTKLMERV